MANRSFCLPAQRKLYKSQRQKAESLSSDSALSILHFLHTPLSTLHSGIEVLINIEKDQVLCDFGFVCVRQMKIEKESGESPS